MVEDCVVEIESPSVPLDSHPDVVPLASGAVQLSFEGRISLSWKQARNVELEQENECVVALEIPDTIDP